MDNLDQDFQHNEEIGFSQNLKSSLKAIRIWSSVSGVLLIIASGIGFIFSMFFLYESFRRMGSYRFYEDLFGSILFIAAAILVFILGFLLKRFSSGLRKGFQNHDQVKIDGAFRKIKAVVIILGVLVGLAFGLLILVTGLILYFSTIYGF